MTPPVNANTALFLDIDGTLLDLARTPDAVIVPDSLKTALCLLSARLDGALAFVSGRSLAMIDTLFAPLKGAAIGCHGAELRGADGVLRTLALPLGEAVTGAFATLAARHPGVLLEDKTYTLALHYRLAPEARGALLAGFDNHAELLAAHHLVVREGKSVFEIKPAGINKGSGVAMLSQLSPFAGREVLCGGDDTTDMDVFAILASLRGQGFSVGRPMPGAAFEFESPEAVRQWLAGLSQKSLQGAPA